MGIIDYFGIQALSRTSYAKFQNFQAPNPFSRTFKGLEKWNNFFKNFQGLSRKSEHPLVAETIAVLKELATLNSVWLVSVPGHRGIPGNEMDDVLASISHTVHRTRASSRFYSAKSTKTENLLETTYYAVSSKFSVLVL